MKYISPCMYEGMSHKKNHIYRHALRMNILQFRHFKKKLHLPNYFFFLNEVYIPLQKYASQHQAASIIFQVCKALLKDATNDVFKIVLS